MAIIHIGIGSNIGNRSDNCQKAIQALLNKGIRAIKVSSAYETEPWGMKEQPGFINMALEAETTLSPESLLAALKDIEKNMKRADTIRWGPRIIDLDILFYDNIILDTDEVKIPHPLMCKRDFVLLPLSEIAPHKVHPAEGKTIVQLKEELLNV